MDSGRREPQVRDWGEADGRMRESACIFAHETAKILSDMG